MQAKLEDEITAIQLEAELTARSLKTSIAVSKAEACGTVIELWARRNGSPLCGAGTEPGAGLKTGQACQYGPYSSLRCPRCLRACDECVLANLLPCFAAAHKLRTRSTVRWDPSHHAYGQA